MRIISSFSLALHRLGKFFDVVPSIGLHDFLQSVRLTLKAGAFKFFSFPPTSLAVLSPVLSLFSSLSLEVIELPFVLCYIYIRLIYSV